MRSLLLPALARRGARGLRRPAAGARRRPRSRRTRASADSRECSCRPARSRILPARRRTRTRVGPRIRRSPSGARPNRSGSRILRASKSCSPNGPVFFMSEVGIFPLQFLEAPDQIVILREASGMPRRIYIDGRGHPDDLEPSWMGHSIGHWDGDTLVVDTVGLNGLARAMNGVGSNAMRQRGRRETAHAVERAAASRRAHEARRERRAARGRAHDQRPEDLYRSR